VDEDRGTGDDQRGAPLTPGTGTSDPLPPALRSRLDSCAADWLRERGHSRSASRAGWFVAAAGFLLAVVGWWPRLTAWSPVAGTGTVGQFSAELAREHLIGQGGGAVRRWDWSVADGSAPGLKGDVAWDVVHQRGYLLLEGLEPNVPARHQYQLWIVDAARDQRYPVDGGVFDVASRGPVVVPVQAAVPVHEPAAFVITVEKPGGTVVSARERVVAVARADTH
jgi:hypothetical protein